MFVLPRSFRRRNLLPFAAVLLAGAPALTPPDPVGTYRLTTVNGARVPVVWHRAELPAGGELRLTWIGGRARVARDGSVTIAVSRTITGPGAPGVPSADTLRGTWRRDARGEVEIRFADGRRATWPPTDGFRSLTIRALQADLDGERRPVTLVLVRE